MSTSYDVARTAGVDQSTVSRALRNDPRVAEATRTRIHEIAKRLNYVPNLTARSLITGRTNSIAVMVADLQNPVYPQLVEAVQDALSARGYRMLLMADRTEGSREKDLDAIRGGVVSGVIFMQGRVDSPLAGNLVAAGLPLVALGRDIHTPDSQVIDRVLSDHVQGGQLAAQYLHDLGHRRIGLITGPANNPSVLTRERAFLARLHDLDVPDDDIVIRRGLVDADNGLASGTELLRLENPPTAVFCATDYVAFGMIDAAARLGRRIPDDVQVMGYDDLTMSSWSVFNLTTIRQPLAEMGTAAANRLLDRIEGKLTDGPKGNVFPVALVERGSTRALRDRGR